mgnify:CR=1 FL=1
MHSVSQQLFAAVPFYAGLTVDTIGGKGVRWWELAARAAAWPDAQAPGVVAGVLSSTPSYEPAATPNGALRLGTYKSIWAAAEVEASPALKFLHPTQRVELAPVDAERLGVRHGEHVTVGSGRASVEAIVHLRNESPAGSAFLQSGIPEGAANVLAGPLVEIRKAVRS